MTPERLAVCVRPGNVRDRPAAHYRRCHPALLRAVPHRGIARATLVIRVKPGRDFGQLLQTLDRTDSASEVADVNGVGFAFCGDRAPKLPNLLHPVHIHVVIFAIKETGRVGFCGGHTAKLLSVDELTAVTMAKSERSGGRPTVGKKTVDRIKPVNLTVDSRHLLGEIGAEHTGPEQPWRLVVRAGRTVWIALEPLWVRFQSFSV